MCSLILYIYIYNCRQATISSHAKLRGQVLQVLRACQTAVTVIRSSDAALKSCLEWLTMSYIIGASAKLIFSAVLQTHQHG